jgi:hypothetical protein
MICHTAGQVDHTNGFVFYRFNPLTPNNLQIRRAVSPLKIKIPSKNMREKQQMQQLFIQFINYVWYLLHVSALHCHNQGAFLVPSERCSIEDQSIKYSRWVCRVYWRGAWRSEIALLVLIRSPCWLCHCRNMLAIVSFVGGVICSTQGRFCGHIIRKCFLVVDPGMVSVCLFCPVDPSPTDRQDMWYIECYHI